MITAAATEAQAAFDCSTVNPGRTSWGVTGVGSTAFAANAKVNPSILCVPTGGSGYSASVPPTTDLPLGNIDGSAGCEQVYNIQSQLTFSSTYTYPPASSIGVECIRGSFSFLNTNYAGFAANSLLDVGNDILVQSNSGLLFITFNSLAVLGVSGFNNDISLKANSALQVADFPALTLINGKLEVISNGSLTDLTGFPSLTDISNSLTIASNPMLDLVLGEFPALTAIGANLDVTGNNAMSTLVLPALGSVSATLASTGVTIYSNDLTTLDLSALAVLDGGFGITSEPNLMGNDITPFVAPIATIGGHFLISNNPSLDHLNAFAVFTKMTGELTINNNDAMTDITGISGVTAVGAGVTVRGQASLPTVDFPSVTALSHLEIRDNDMMTALGFASLVALTTELKMYGNAALPDVGLTTVGFPVLAAIGTQLNIQSHPAMTDLVFPALAAMGWQLWVGHNTALTTVSFPALLGIGGELHLNNNTALPAIGGPLLADPGFPVLNTVASRIYLDHNTALAYFRLPSLTAITAPIGGGSAQVWVKYNTAMARFVLDNWVDPAGVCGPGGPGLSLITAKANMGVCADLFAFPGCGLFVGVSCTP